MVAAHFAIVLDADHGHRFTAAQRVEHAGFERLPDRRRRLRLRDRFRPSRVGVGGGFLAGRERGSLRVQHDAGDAAEGNWWDYDRKSTRLNFSHLRASTMQTSSRNK